MADARVEVDFIANANSVEAATASMARGIERNAAAAHVATRKQISDVGDLERASRTLAESRRKASRSQQYVSSAVERYEKGGVTRQQRGEIERGGRATAEAIGISEIERLNRELQAKQSAAFKAQMARRMSASAADPVSVLMSQRSLTGLMSESGREQAARSRAEAEQQAAASAERDRQLARPYTSLGSLNQDYRQLERQQRARQRQARMDAIETDQIRRSRSAAEERADFRSRREQYRASRQLPWHVGEAEERLARIQQRRGGGGGIWSGRGGSALVRELSIMGSQFGLPYLGLGMGSAAATVGGVGAAGFLAYRHHEDQVARREAIRTSVNDPITALRNMRMNFDFSNLSEFESRLGGVSRRWGVGMTDVASMAADALSAGGQLTQDKILGAVNAGSAMFPRDMEASRAVSGGVMDIMKIANARGQEISPEAVAGFLVQMGRANRAVSLGETARWGAQALSTVAGANPNDSLAYLTRLYTAITQMAPDPTGRTSRTGFIRLGEAMQEWKPEGGVTRSGNVIDEAEAAKFREAGTMQERLAILQASPGLQAAFWESHDFEAPIKGAMQSIVAGSKRYVDAMAAATNQIGELNEGLAKVYQEKLKMAGSGPGAITEETNRKVDAIIQRLGLESSGEQRIASSRDMIGRAADAGGFWRGTKWSHQLFFDATKDQANPEVAAIYKISQMVIALQESSDADKEQKIKALQEMISALQDQMAKNGDNNLANSDKHPDLVAREKAAAQGKESDPKESVVRKDLVAKAAAKKKRYDELKGAFGLEVDAENARGEWLDAEGKVIRYDQRAASLRGKRQREREVQASEAESAARWKRGVGGRLGGPLQGVFPSSAPSESDNSHEPDLLPPDPAAAPVAAAPAATESAIRQVWRNRMLHLPGISGPERAFLNQQAAGMTDDELAAQGGHLIEEAQGKEGRNSDRDRMKTDDAFKAWEKVTGDRQTALLETLVDQMGQMIALSGTPTVIRTQDRRAPASSARFLSRTENVA